MMTRLFRERLNATQKSSQTITHRLFTAHISFDFRHCAPQLNHPAGPALNYADTGERFFPLPTFFIPLFRFNLTKRLNWVWLLLTVKTRSDLRERLSPIRCPVGGIT